VLVFAIEAGVIAIVFGVSPWMVLQTATDFELTVRPGWVVLGAGLAVVALDIVRLVWVRRMASRQPQRASSRPIRAAKAETTAS